MTTLHGTFKQDCTLDRIFSDIENRIVTTENRAQWQGFADHLQTAFPNLFQCLTDLYSNQWDLYYHMSKVVELAAKHWLSQGNDKTHASHDWINDKATIGATGYVDLFGGDLKGVKKRIPYLQDLGISYLHLMPFFDVPSGDSDGGYAIKNYGAVNPNVGTMKDLKSLSSELKKKNIKLVLDFVFNHTSDQHEWAEKAKRGDERFQQFYWLFETAEELSPYSPYLREIFPDKRDSCFTWNETLQRHVWTTFNSFQWDLNYQNPDVFVAMCTEMLKLVEAGADVVRLDALAFTWKEAGTSCENLPKAHRLIQAFNAFLNIASPQTLLKSEAIVAPDEVVHYISKNECQLSYNPNLMALMWEALATRETKLLTNGTLHRSHLPVGTQWINYLRCHDDIGWAFADDDAWGVGINPQDHRYFLNQFYTGQFNGSFAHGVPFQYNPKNGDCRISGNFASLVGFADDTKNEEVTNDHSGFQRYLLMYGVLVAFKGIPLIYLGDEIGMLNDYSYVNNPDYATDSRWVHRVKLTDEKANKRNDKNSFEYRMFEGLKNFIHIRSQHEAMGSGDIQIEPFLHPNLYIFRRLHQQEFVLIIANFSEHQVVLTTDQLIQLGISEPTKDLLTDLPIQRENGLTLTSYQQYWLTNNLKEEF